MASGGETKFSCCSACLDDGRNTVAGHYCVDCEMYFCTKCVKCHNLIPASRKHQVNDVNSSYSVNVDDDSTERGSESVHSSRCTLHQGKLIDTYCKDHDEVCCGACVVIIHRSCTTVSIAIAAKDFKSGPDMNKCKETLTENLIQCKQWKKKHSDNLDCIDKQKLELITKVDQCEEKIIAKIQELANNSRKEIRSKYDELKTALETDIDALDGVITTNTEYVDHLEQTDDQQLFVYVKANRINTKVCENVFQAKTNDWTMKELKFDFDEELENRVFKMTSFGRLGEDSAVKMYHAVFERNVNVEHWKDTHAVTVIDMCLMNSSDLLMTDYYNKKLKRFNSDLQFKDELPLSGMPIAVCKIDKHVVAVRIWNTKVIHIVSVGQSMQIMSFFTLADNGYGMTYDTGTREIFACEDNCVSVYSKTGHKLRTYDKDTNGEQMFSRCRQIALSMNKHDIYVTDLSKGLIVLDKSGTLKMKVSLPGVCNTWPLCVLPGYVCLAGSQSSGVFIQIDKDGKQVGNLFDSKNGRTHTYCSVYDYEQSRLIVGGYSQLLSTYTISATG